MIVFVNNKIIFKGAEEGSHKWSDLEYFNSLNPGRHAFVHFITGFRKYFEIKMEFAIIKYI